MGTPFARWVEARALEIRHLSGSDACSPLDPFSVAEHFRMSVISPRDIPGIPEEAMQVLLHIGWRCWSGIAITKAGGKVIVVLNPRHSEERRRATLMEEVSHIHLRHRPALLDGRFRDQVIRIYRTSEEKQAFAVAAAALIPYGALSHLAGGAADASEVARLYGVSPDLLAYRIRVCGLWSESPLVDSLRPNVKTPSSEFQIRVANGVGSDITVCPQPELPFGGQKSQPNPSSLF